MKSGIRASRAEETRVALIEAARRLFGQRGYHATGTHEIVAEAGVTRGALQHHFARKEDLFLAVFHQVEKDEFESMMERQADERPGERWWGLRRTIGNYLTTISTSEVSRIMLLDGPAVLGWTEWRRLEMHFGLGLMMGAVEDAIAAGTIAPQPPAALAHLILSMVNEAALFVANADDPVAAIREAQGAIDALLFNQQS